MTARAPSTTAILLGCGVVLLCGAFAALWGDEPHRAPYRPTSRDEAVAWSKAERGVFPRDVREHPGASETTLVAWAGVITDFTSTEDAEGLTVYVGVDHRYFDWTQTGADRPSYRLSARGEGPFRAGWSLPPSAAGTLSDDFAVGRMLLVYGVPSGVIDGAVTIFPTEFLRSVPRERFRDDGPDYGRPGEPAGR